MLQWNHGITHTLEDLRRGYDELDTDPFEELEKSTNLEKSNHADHE